MKDKTIMENLTDIIINKPYTKRTKRLSGTDINTTIDITHNKTYRTLVVYASGDFISATPPKAKAPIWKVFTQRKQGKQDCLVVGLTKQAAIDFAIMTLEKEATAKQGVKI